MKPIFATVRGSRDKTTEQYRLSSLLEGKTVQYYCESRSDIALNVAQHQVKLEDWRDAPGGCRDQQAALEKVWSRTEGSLSLHGELAPLPS